MHHIRAVSDQASGEAAHAVDLYGSRASHEREEGTHITTDASNSAYTVAAETPPLMARMCCVKEGDNFHFGTHADRLSLTHWQSAM